MSGNRPAGISRGCSKASARCAIEPIKRRPSLSEAPSKALPLGKTAVKEAIKIVPWKKLFPAGRLRPLNLRDDEKITQAGN